MPLMVAGENWPVLYDAAHTTSITIHGYMATAAAVAQNLAVTAVGTPLVVTASAPASSATSIVKDQAAIQAGLDSSAPRNVLLCFAGLFALCVLLAHPQFLARLFASLSPRPASEKPAYAFSQTRLQAKRQVGGGDLDQGWILRAGKRLPRLLSPSPSVEYGETKSLASLAVDDYYFSDSHLSAQRNGASDDARGPTLIPPPHIRPVLARIPYSSVLSYAPFARMPGYFQCFMTLPALYLVACYLLVILFAVIWRSDLTPATKAKGYGADNTRSGLVAMTQIPIAVALGVRGNIIGLAVGKGYERLKFFHKLVGRVTFLCATVHMALYLHKFTAAGTFSVMMKKPLVMAGLAAWVCLAVVAITSLPQFRKTFYGLFEVCHILGLAGLLGGLAMHVEVARPFCMAAGIIYAISIIMSLCKTRLATAELTAIPGAETTLVSIPALRTGWRAGQHVRIRVPALGLKHGIQSHPFSIASAPNGDGIVLMCKAAGDWTKHLLQFAASTSGIEAGALGLQTGKQATIFVEGPYGGLGHTLPTSFSSVVLFAGGSGITHALALANDLVARAPSGVVRARTVDLIWIVRTQEVAQPLVPSLIQLVNDAKSLEKRCLAARKVGGDLPDPVALRVKVYITRSPASSPLDLLPTLQTVKVDQLFEHGDFDDGADLRSSPSAAEQEKTAYLARSESSRSASTLASGKSYRYGSQRDNEPLSEITTQGGRPHLDLAVCELVDETITRHRGRRDAQKAQGVLVTACGPGRLTDDVRAAVRAVGEWRATECGGIEMEAEQFGF